ncbi:MAG: hypothetical protein P8O22_08740 [Akkermansiaceae bacterium]|nr:hypothetical protein [Akkermansiaceae bacterium]
MHIIDLNLDHWNFFCPATGHKIQADGEEPNFTSSLKGVWVEETPNNPQIKDSCLQHAWNKFIVNFDEESNEERHYTFKNGSRLKIDNITIYKTDQFSRPIHTDIIILSFDVSKDGSCRAATLMELNELNEDQAFLRKLCSDINPNASDTKDFLKNYNAPNWIAFHIRSGTAAFNDSAMYIIDMNTRNQKTLTNA